MLALQQIAPLQQPSAPDADSGVYLTPGMLGKVSVYYTSSPGEMGQLTIQPGALHVHALAAAGPPEWWVKMIVVSKQGVQASSEGHGTCNGTLKKIRG